jgi:hypothetical protein
MNKTAMNRIYSSSIFGLFHRWDGTAARRKTGNNKHYRATLVTQMLFPARSIRDIIDTEVSLLFKCLLLAKHDLVVGNS